MNLRKIIFFDGECGFCARSIQVLLNLDTEGVLRFAPLQGETSARNLPKELREKDNLSTLVFAQEEKDGNWKIKIKSDAICSALYQCGGFARVLSYLRIIPRFVRDSVYDFIAKHRMSLFKAASCSLPSEEQRKRFLP